VTSHNVFIRTVILLCCEGGLLSTYCNVLSTFFQFSFNFLSIFFQRSVNVLSTFFQRSFNVLSIFFQLVGGSFILVSINILVEHFKTTARVDSGGMERLVGHSFPHRAGRVVDPGTTGRTTGRGEPKGRTLVDK
jgi:hypothetical protein